MNKSVKKWRDAATLIVAARSGPLSNGYKILMLKRSSKSKFMPNAYVFPGGVSSPNDFRREWMELINKSNDHSRFEQLKKVSSKKPLLYSNNLENDGLMPELAFRICALRETFEESGILLLRDEQGNNLILDDPKHNIGGKYNTLKGWRDKINEDDSCFFDLFKQLNCAPDISALYEWSTWLTPTFRTTRFNAMFYICFVDNIRTQSEDYAETVHSDWMTPFSCLSKHFNRDLQLELPQIYETNRFNRYKSFKELQNFAVSRESTGLETWCPYKIRLQNGHVVVYPGDDYHTITDVNAESSEIDMTIEELRNISTNLNRVEHLDGKKVTIRNNTEWCGHPPLGIITDDIYKPIER